MKNDRWFLIGVVGLFSAVIVGAAAWGWYKAGIQQEVYRRQGVEMSRWEVYLGAKPVERYVKP